MILWSRVVTRDLCFVTCFDLYILFLSCGFLIIVRGVISMCGILNCVNDCGVKL